MAIASTDDLIGELRSLTLLEPADLAKLAALQKQQSSLSSLTEVAVERGWLTAFQVKHLLRGRGLKLVLGAYVILEPLGEGGMGTVYKARHQKLGRLVALKVIRKERLANPNAVRRFQREMRAAGRISHPNIIQAFDADQVGETHMFAMEYVEGVDLAKLMKDRGPLPVRDACEYMRQAALGLQHAHECGLVHRDIKPQNLLLGRNGGSGSDAEEPRLRILDMGLARLDDDEDSSTLTREGAVVGTVDYLAPEQAANAHQADFRSDLYSLGCTFYHLLTGKVPFPGGTTVQKLYRHNHEEPPAIELQRPDVPAAVAAVVCKLMAKQPAERYRSAQEVAEVLGRVLAGKKVPSVPEVDISGPPRKGIPVGVPRSRSKRGSSKTKVTVKPRRSLSGCLWVGTLGTLFVLLTGTFLALFLSNTNDERNSGKATEAEPLEPLLVNSLEIKLVLIPAGTFAMGSAAGVPGAEADEKPQHTVTLTKPFYLGIHEVAQSKYVKIMGENPSYFRDKPTQPVEQVSWHKAVEFCRKLSALPDELKAGRTYRLPTEAEWEYACRAGSTTTYTGGLLLSDQDAHFDKQHGIGRPNRVGAFPQNKFGLFDMHGNVWEWCADWYSSTWYAESPPTDPQGPAAGPARVIRGGGYTNSANSCRSATRGHYLPNLFYRDIGFRVACDVNPRRDSSK